MGGSLMSRLIIVGAGLLYPAYSSYKAVKGANARQYIRWLMYWIVFALFTAIESITDIFLSWLPFYFELKIIVVFWLVLPYTRGSSIIYRKFIHPNLLKREEEIDLFLENARERSYETALSVGSKGINLAANAVVHAAAKGQSVVSSTLNSYSVPDLANIQDHPGIHRQTHMPLTSPPVAHERHVMTSDPAIEVDGDMSDFKSFSMMNLSQECSEDLKVETRNVLNDDGFSTEPPEFTTDDMQITKRNHHAESSAYPEDFTSHYTTLPRPKKGVKNLPKQMPPLPQVESSIKRRGNQRVNNQELSD